VKAAEAARARLVPLKSAAECQVQRRYAGKKTNCPPHCEISHMCTVFSYCLYNRYLSTAVCQRLLQRCLCMIVVSFKLSYCIWSLCVRSMSGCLQVDRQRNPQADRQIGNYAQTD